MADLSLVISILVIINSVSCERDDYIRRKMEALNNRSKELYGTVGDDVKWDNFDLEYLMYPRGDKRKLSIMSRAWQEYYECLARLAESVPPPRFLANAITMLFQGSVARLPCDLCAEPGTTEHLTWIYSKGGDEINITGHLTISNHRRPRTPETFLLGVRKLRIVGDSRIANTGMGGNWASGNLTHRTKHNACVVSWRSSTAAIEDFSDIQSYDRLSVEGRVVTIYNVIPEDEGVYSCRDGDTQGGIVIIEVVDTENYTVVKPTTSRGPHPVAPETYEGVILSTQWSQWSECSVCDKVGRRHRYGICYVNLDQNLIADYLVDSEKTTARFKLMELDIKLIELFQGSSPTQTPSVINI
uniref:SFRICE_016464 n=1 Tax=Spodoptera frugiperda TaxID=7108 RepID=A0A2H1WHG0_SPOFR